MDQMPSSTSSRPMVCCLSDLATKSNRCLNRNVPALVMRFTRKCPGYSLGGRVPVEDRAHAGALGREPAVAREQVAGGLVGDREWIAVDDIASPKVAFEVRRPQIIESDGLDRHHPGMLARRRHSAVHATPLNSMIC